MKSEFGINLILFPNRGVPQKRNYNNLEFTTAR